MGDSSGLKREARPILLACFVAICAAAAPSTDPDTAPLVVAGMLAVSAMAVQNALVRLSLRGAPATAVMTSNITLFIVDVGEMLFGRDPAGVAAARNRAKHTWPALAGFFLGLGLGAPCESTFGLMAMILPTGFSLAALALGMAASSHPAKDQLPITTKKSA